MANSRILSPIGLQAMKFKSNPAAVVMVIHERSSLYSNMDL